MDKQLAAYLDRVSGELWCVERQARAGALDEIKAHISEKARGIASAKGLDAGVSMREAIASFGDPVAVSRDYIKVLPKGLGTRLHAFLAFLFVISIFSVLHGLSSFANIMYAINSFNLEPGDLAFTIYVANAVTQAVRFVFGVLVIGLAALMLKRPDRTAGLRMHLLGLSTIVIIMSMSAVTGMLVHRTVYAREPLLEWSAIFAFMPWLIFIGLLVVFLGHRRMQRFVELTA